MGQKIMTKVDQLAKDKNVESYIVYGKAADNKIYYDAEYTNQVTQADLQDAFKKGMLLIHTVASSTVTYYRPVSVSENSAVIITVASSTATPVTYTAAAAE